MCCCDCVIYFLFLNIFVFEGYVGKSNIKKNYFIDVIQSVYQHKKRITFKCFYE